MSSTIDERIVAMKFNNAQFEKNVKTSTNTLDGLKKSLNLDGAKKGLEDLNSAGNRFSLQGIADGVRNISGYFNTMAFVGITALANLASRAVDAGITIAKSLTIDPIKSGLQEYETNLNSIQTILANTESKGTTLDQVNDALAELNKYSDQTIYNFAEMARNIGTFTAAGVDLKTSTAAIKGIANLAAVSGSNSQQAATAMYQLSQALSTGTVKLMDWNSVVNAGMGGQFFQDAIKQTARNHGVAVDAIIKKEGSFRDSLQKGWLTSEILTETLSKLTGDLSDQQLKSMGYSDKQIKQIQKQAKTAQDAATKVKTMSQLIGTLQEASGSGWSQTWQLMFGDFDQAKELFTNVNNVLGGMINAASDSRNKLIGGWNTLGGRDEAINAISYAFEALMSVVKPIGEALKQLFPPATALQLLNITVALRNFAKTLILSDRDAENLKRTFAGVFAIFSIGWEILKAAGRMFADLFGFATEGSNGILEYTGNVGDFLVMIDKAIKSGDGLNQFFDGLGKVLKAPITLIKAIITGIGAFIDTIGEIGVAGNAIDTVAGFFDRLQERFAPMGKLGEYIKTAWGGVVAIFEKIKNFVAPIIEDIKQRMSDFGETIGDAMANADYSLVLDTINTALFGGIVLIIGNFFKNLKKSSGKGITETFKELIGAFKDGFAGSGTMLNDIKTVFQGLSGTLESMQQNLKAKTLITIAAAIALLTASVIALSLIDSDKLTAALTAMTVMFTQLFGSMAIFEKLTASASFKQMPLVAASMILLGIALNILASAVKKLSELEWEGLAKGLVGVTVLMGIMIATSKLMSKNAPGLFVSSVALVIMAGAIRTLVSSVTQLAGLTWEELARGMAGVGALLLAVVAFTRTVGNPLKIIVTAVAISILGVALKLLASVLNDFAQMSWEDTAKGLAAMAVALVIVANAVRLLPKTLIVSAAGLVVVAAALNILADALIKMSALSWDDIGRVAVVLAGSLLIIAGAMYLMTGALPGAAALILVAFSLGILADAFLKMAELSWDDIGRAAVVLAGSLLIIAGAMYLMTAALPGAAALVVVGVALTLLIPVLLALGAMSWDQIGTGLGALAATLGILAAAGILILPAIPGLIGLGIAIGLIGLGAALAGAGVLMFAAGLTALSAAGAGGLAMIGPAIQEFVELIPEIAAGVGRGILAMADVIAEGGSSIFEALKTVLLSLIQAITEVAPELIDAAVLLITKLIEALVVLIPLLVDAGLRLIKGILKGVADNIGMVIQRGTDVIIAFMKGISKAIPRLLQAGADFIVDFLNGLAKTIRKNTDRINKAGANVADAIIDGMVKGIGNGVDVVVRAIQKVAGGALEAAKKVLGIASPSKEFDLIGQFMMKGQARGILKLGGTVVKAASSVAHAAIDTLRNAISNVGNIVGAEMDSTPSIRPVLDLSAVRKDASLISGLITPTPLNVSGTYRNAEDIAISRSDQAEAIIVDDDSDHGPDEPTMVFNQYNNSPKALSEIDLYRQTKTAFAAAKKELIDNANQS